MRSHELVHSQEGSEGGYVLRVEPERVNPAQMPRVIDGPIASTPCVSKHYYKRCDDCLDEELCRMMQVRNANPAVHEPMSQKVPAT